MENKKNRIIVDKKIMRLIGLFVIIGLSLSDIYA